MHTYLHTHSQSWLWYYISAYVSRSILNLPVVWRKLYQIQHQEIKFVSWNEWRFLQKMMVQPQGIVIKASWWQPTVHNNLFKQKHLQVDFYMFFQHLILWHCCVYNYFIRKIKTEPTSIYDRRSSCQATNKKLYIIIFHITFFYTWSVQWGSDKLQ